MTQMTQINPESLNVASQMILKEIDLGGTDAERKAKLDQFETDWKALTGTDDILGARFVGYMGTPSGELSTIFACNSMSGFYEGVGTDDVEKIYKIQVNPSAGNIHLTPLFSHLEPVEIFTDNSAASKQKNIDNLNAYKSNLEKLGVNTANGFQMLIKIGNDQYGMLANSDNLNNFKGYSSGFGKMYNLILQSSSGAVISSQLQSIKSNDLVTTQKEIVPAINEGFTLAQALKDLHTPVPLTATTSTNKTQLDSFLSKVPNAQFMYCTYKDVYAGTLYKINGSWYGVLVGESNTIAGQLSIKLQADGTIVEGAA